MHNTEPEKAIETWLVSACLMGKACRYDGECARESAQSRIVSLKSKKGVKLVAVCPEELGGLSTPRLPASFVSGEGHDALKGKNEGRIEDSQGEDVTHAFVKGAQSALQIAKQHGATHACLKERSPSCGSSFVHSAKTLQKGMGVTAALLSQSGLRVVSEETLDAYFKNESGLHLVSDNPKNHETSTMKNTSKESKSASCK